MTPREIAAELQGEESEAGVILSDKLIVIGYVSWTPIRARAREMARKGRKG